MLTRRELVTTLGQAFLAPHLGPLMTSFSGAPAKSTRCVNVVNFIRGVEPRFKTDLLLPVQKQMELIKEHKLPATWLLQFDALVSGPFVSFLKDNKAGGHEVGTWFEMNEMHCKAAGVEWRGRRGYEWDHLPFVAFSIGYTKDERIKLADTAMHEFKKVWGHYPQSVASWNLDSWTMAHLTETYGIDAYAVCRDQIATDGFTIWGAPIAGYYPSSLNCWSPALEEHHQIGTPVFRMLGQDPVYYYGREWKMPDGKMASFPDTMEPVWPSGQSHTFVDRFLAMIEQAPTLRFAYLQMGQENSFPWPDQAAAYPYQMAALAEMRDRGKVHVETMGESGRRFKKTFKVTPAQSQVQLSDPFGIDPPSESIWYQSRFYRANLHIKEGLPYLRDLTVYRDDLKQPFLESPTRDSFVEQRMPAVLDGYHWAGPQTGGFFMVDGQEVRVAGEIEVSEERESLIIRLPLASGRLLTVAFNAETLSASISGGSLALSFQWDPSKSAFRGFQGTRIEYRREDADYAIEVLVGKVSKQVGGYEINQGPNEIRVRLAQR